MSIKRREEIERAESRIKWNKDVRKGTQEMRNRRVKQGEVGALAFEMNIES